MAISSSSRDVVCLFHGDDQEDDTLERCIHGNVISTSKDSHVARTDRANNGDVSDITASMSGSNVINNTSNRVVPCESSDGTRSNDTKGNNNNNTRFHTHMSDAEQSITPLRENNHNNHNNNNNNYNYNNNNGNHANSTVEEGISLGMSSNCPSISSNSANCLSEHCGEVKKNCRDNQQMYYSNVTFSRKRNLELSSENYGNNRDNNRMYVDTKRGALISDRSADDNDSAPRNDNEKQFAHFEKKRPIVLSGSDSSIRTKTLSGVRINHSGGSQCDPNLDDKSGIYVYQGEVISKSEPSSWSVEKTREVNSFEVVLRGSVQTRNCPKCCSVGVTGTRECPSASSVGALSMLRTGQIGNELDVNSSSKYVRHKDLAGHDLTKNCPLELKRLCSTVDDVSELSGSLGKWLPDQGSEDPGIRLLEGNFVGLSVSGRSAISSPCHHRVSYHRNTYPVENNHKKYHMNNNLPGDFEKRCIHRKDPAPILLKTRHGFTNTSVALSSPKIPEGISPASTTDIFSRISSLPQSGEICPPRTGNKKCLLRYIQLLVKDSMECRRLYTGLFTINDAVKHVGVNLNSWREYYMNSGSGRDTKSPASIVPGQVAACNLSVLSDNTDREQDDKNSLDSNSNRDKYIEGSEDSNTDENINKPRFELSDILTRLCLDDGSDEFHSLSEILKNPDMLMMSSVVKSSGSSDKSSLVEFVRVGRGNFEPKRKSTLRRTFQIKFKMLRREILKVFRKIRNPQMPNRVHNTGENFKLPQLRSEIPVGCKQNVVSKTYQCTRVVKNQLRPQRYLTSTKKQNIPQNSLLPGFIINEDCFFHGKYNTHRLSCQMHEQRQMRSWINKMTDDNDHTRDIYHYENVDIVLKNRDDLRSSRCASKLRRMSAVSNMSYGRSMTDDKGKKKNDAEPNRKFFLFRRYMARYRATRYAYTLFSRFRSSVCSKRSGVIFESDTATERNGVSRRKRRVSRKVGRRLAGWNIGF